MIKTRKSLDFIVRLLCHKVTCVSAGLCA